MFSNYSKIFVYLKNAIKIAENVLGFWDNCVRNSSRKISLLWRECMWSLVSLLKQSAKFSHLTKRDLSVLDLSDINGKLASKNQGETFQQCFGPVNSFMWLPVNLLTHSPKIYDLTNRDFSDLDLSNINWKLASKHRRETFQLCLGPVNSVTSKGCSQAGAFEYSRNHILRCQ